MMMLELVRVVGEMDAELRREHQDRRLTARQLRALRREERRATEMITETAWSRLC